MKPRHLYVHAAFCARRCSYCDFAVHVAAEPPVDAWATTIGRELAGVARERGWDGPLPLDTLYLGGGTPSLLGPGAVARMLETLGPAVALDELREFTAEANPESFTPDVARAWVAAGVDRVSFGAQTFHAPTLRWMGRLHGPEGPVRAVARARRAEIGNLSLDLIFGLPERLGRDLDQDLDRVLALEPEHVSVYGLSVETGTPLGRRVAEGRERLPEQERYGEEYLRVAERLVAAGFVHYEVSNFARPGRESRHNSAYWRGVPYLGLGNGAHSFIDPERWWNRRDWYEYRRAVESDGTGRESGERVTAAERRLETVWLGLRTRDGLPLSELNGRQEAVARSWPARGWAEPIGGLDGTTGATAGAEPRIRLTVEGWLLLDRLAVELVAAGEGAEAAQAGRAAVGGG